MSIPSIETLLRRIRVRRMLREIFWRHTPEARKWFAEVRANRARHPYLLAEEERGADPEMIAYEMLRRDRLAIRGAHKNRIIRGEVSHYPAIGDYLLPESPLQLAIAQRRRVERQRDLDAANAAYKASL